MASLIFSAEPSSPWFWESMLAIALVLVSLNVLLIVLVHGRRIRQYVRGGRERRFQARVERGHGEARRTDERRATGSGCGGSLPASTSWNGRWPRSP